MDEFDRQQLDRIMRTARSSYARLTTLATDIAAFKRRGEDVSAAELQSRFDVELEALRGAYLDLKTFQATHLDTEVVRSAISEIDGYFRALGVRKPAV